MPLVGNRYGGGTLATVANAWQWTAHHALTDQRVNAPKEEINSYALEGANPTLDGFILSDDFSTLDLEKWEVITSGTASAVINGGRLRLSASGIGSSVLVKSRQAYKFGEARIGVPVLPSVDGILTFQAYWADVPDGSWRAGLRYTAADGLIHSHIATGGSEDDSTQVYDPVAMAHVGVNSEGFLNAWHTNKSADGANFTEIRKMSHNADRAKMAERGLVVMGLEASSATAQIAELDYLNLDPAGIVPSYGWGTRLR